MRLELVLAGLAREDDDKGETTLVEDGILDGAGDLDLVGTQSFVAGLRPGDGGAANGISDGLGEGERRKVSCVRFQVSRWEGRRSKVEG